MGDKRCDPTGALSIGIGPVAAIVLGFWVRFSRPVRLSREYPVWGPPRRAILYREARSEPQSSTGSGFAANWVCLEKRPRRGGTPDSGVDQFFKLGDFLVTWTLTPTEGDALVRMEQSGFRPEDEANYQGAGYGWRRFVDGLERVAAGLG